MSARRSPQARLVALAECGTHAMFDAELGPYTSSERAWSKTLIDRLEPGMVLLADRGFYGFALWKQASATGADLVWRAKNNVTPRHIETFEDGSWLGELRASNTKLNTEHVVVRVVDYHVDDGRGAPTGVRGRPPRRHRPRPGLIRRSTTHHPPLALTGARFFPL